MIEHKKQEKKPGKQIVIALMLTVLVISSALVGCGAKKTADNENVVPESTVQEVTVATEPAVTEVTLLMPWEEVGAKQPQDYTWEEYEALTGVQQKAFRAYMGTEYSQWLDGMRVNADVQPWDESDAKQPDAYTWAEFTALTPAQQMAFQQYLGLDAFSAWMNSVQPQVGEMPWDAYGAKQPADYTWEEFNSLTGSQQMIFQYQLGSEGFQSWLETAEHQDEILPWEIDGAKQPEDYTWTEFESLTPEEQMAFQTYMGAESFDIWMNSAQTQLEKNPWEMTGAKQPEEYTWAEFESLTPAQQMAFQTYLGAEGFDSWINRAQIQTEANPWEAAGAKQPEDYTWAEFESLTPAQKMAFQNVMGQEAFDAWLNKTATP